MQTSERTPGVDKWEPVGSSILTVGGLGALETGKDTIPQCLIMSNSWKYAIIWWYKMKCEDLDEGYLYFCSHVARNPGQNKDSLPGRTLVYVQANPLMTLWGNSVKSVFRCCASLVAPCKRREPFSRLLSRWWRNQSDLVQLADSWWSPVRWPQTLEWVVLECTLWLSEMMLVLLQTPHENRDFTNQTTTFYRSAFKLVIDSGLL